MIEHTELYKSLLLKVIEAATEAGEFIKEEINQVSKEDIEEKERYSLVSYVDKTAEEIIIAKLLETTFAARFIAEENTDTPDIINTDYTWVIDPLDGTTNYLKKIPHFAVSIGLELKGVPVLGVVFDIMQDDCYSAIIDQGAFLNGQKLFLASEKLLSNSIVATGFPYSKKHGYDDKLAAIKYFLENAQDLRRMGSAALDLVYVASGKIDAYYEAHLNRWDFSAGSLIAKEAGAIVTDYSNDNKYLDKGEIIASHPAIHDSVLVVIKKHLG